MTIAAWLCRNKNNPCSNDPLLECLSKLLLQVELLKPNCHGDAKEGSKRLAEELNIFNAIGSVCYVIKPQPQFVVKLNMLIQQL